ncbi:MAG: transcriptional regulator [Nocardioides sp.]|nr:transcriptional regulator [Nocardioides sp.]
MTEQDGVGLAVRRARTQAGLTLRDLASGIGVSVGTMSAVENGKVALTLARLTAIAEHLGTTVADLLVTDRGPEPGPTRGRDGTWREFERLDLSGVESAAASVFAETGYHGATIRMIAATADISVAGVYHHVRSKQQLLVTLLDVVMDELHWRVRAAEEAATDPADRLARMVEALVLVHTHRLRLAFVAATELRSVEEPDRGRLVAARDGLQEALDRAVVRGVHAGAFATRNPHRTARAIMTMCMSLSYWYLPEDEAVPAEVAREYADLALDMVRARTA